MLPSNLNNIFISKVFCMNTHPPAEVSRLDHDLLEFSAKIKPDEHTMKQQRSNAQTIAEILKADSTYGIDRMVFAGSFGKRTNTQKSDVDCVFFINDQLPPFGEVLAKFYDICNKPAIKNSFNSFNVKLNKNSLNFTINGLEMDVVLATNFVKNLKRHQSLPHIQQKYALKMISLNPAENCYKYSSALAEATIYFMKTRVGFANEMARIAKYWFNSLGIDFKHISGASTFIETVAVHAARKGRHGNRKYNPYLKAFIRFLEKLTNFQKLDVSFKRCNAMFKEHSPGDTTLPRCIDPVNPYNNFLDYWNGDDIEAIERCAASTLERIQNLILNPGATEGDSMKVLFR